MPSTFSPPQVTSRAIWTRLVGDVLDGAGDRDLDAGVVVGDDDRLGELAAELDDPARLAGPGVDGAGGQRQGEHAVRDHAGQPDRLRRPGRTSGSG